MDIETCTRALHYAQSDDNVGFWFLWALVSIASVFWLIFVSTEPRAFDGKRQRLLVIRALSIFIALWILPVLVKAYAAILG